MEAASEAELSFADDDEIGSFESRSNRGRGLDEPCNV